jgi:hypothetical protein
VQHGFRGEVPGERRPAIRDDDDDDDDDDGNNRPVVTKEKYLNRHERGLSEAHSNT